MRRWIVGLVMVITQTPGLAAAAGPEKLNGYAEWREEGMLVVDGQRVMPGPKMKLKAGKVKAFDAIPLG